MTALKLIFVALLSLWAIVLVFLAVMVIVYKIECNERERW